MQAQIQLAHKTQGESRGLFELNPTLRCEASSLKHVDFFLKCNLFCPRLRSIFSVACKI